MCSIPKVGSTVWKRTLMLLAGNVSEKELNQSNSEYITARNPSQFAQHRKVQAHYGLYKTTMYSKKEFKYRIKKYFKFIFVRNPWRRLLSAYLDKFTIHDQEHRVPYQKKAQKIIKRYHKDQMPSQIMRAGILKNVTGMVTFSEFLSYIMDDWEMRRHADLHWTRYIDHCKPCTTHYDFLGHMETFHEDAAYIVQHVFKSKLNISRVMSSKLGPSKADTYVNVSGYYNQVNPKLLQRVKEYLSPDFRVFGYNPNEVF